MKMSFQFIRHQFSIVVLLVGLHVSEVVGTLKLVIMHTNDMHSRLNEIGSNTMVCTKIASDHDDCYGGFPRVKGAADQIRQEYENNPDPNKRRKVLFLNGGDNYQGTSFYTLLKWKAISEFIDDFKFDAMALGNHEFDGGPEGLEPYLNEIKTISVSANLDLSQTPSLQNNAKLKPYHILTVDPRNTKIAVIGYVLPATKDLSNPGTVTFKDEIESINKCTAEIKKKHPDIKIFIALGHSGHDKDKEIAMKCPDIDIVVGAHSDTFLYTGPKPNIDLPKDVYPVMVPKQGNPNYNVPVVQAHGYTKYIGVLEVDIDDNGQVTRAFGNPRLLNRQVPQDQAMLTKVKNMQNKIDAQELKYGGKVYTDLISHENICRYLECNAGNAIADAFVLANAEHYQGTGWTDASIGFIQGGGVRASIEPTDPEGNIKYGDVMRVLPIQDQLIKMFLRGDHLKQLLEFSVHKVHHNDGEGVKEFLSVSGIQMVVDLAKPAYQRVISVKVRCSSCIVPEYFDLDLSREYGVITTSFLSRGGDRFTLLAQYGYKKGQIGKSGISDTDALHRYITQRSPLIQGIDDRVLFLNKNLLYKKVEDEDAE